MAKRTLRLYIWDEVLCDYTCGIAFAIAASADEARGMLVALPNVYFQGHELQAEPEVHELDTPFAHAIHGGG